MSIKIKSKEPISTIYSPSHEIECQRPDRHTALVRIDKAGDERARLVAAFVSARRRQDMVTRLVAGLPRRQDRRRLFPAPGRSAGGENAADATARATRDDPGHRSQRLNARARRSEQVKAARLAGRARARTTARPSTSSIIPTTWPASRPRPVVKNKAEHSGCRRLHSPLASRGRDEPPRRRWPRPCVRNPAKACCRSCFS